MKKLTLVLGLAIVSFSALAQTPPAPPATNPATPGIDNRQNRQEQRITQGEASGQLNAHEANRLDAREQHITNLQSKAAAGGDTPAEKARVAKAERRTSKHIRKQAHDANTAPAQ